MNYSYESELKRFNKDLSRNFFPYKNSGTISADIVSSNSVEQFKNRFDRVIHIL